MTVRDKPDYYSPYSLEKLLTKLNQYNGKNYCNIPEDNPDLLFEGNVITSIGDEFGKLSKDCTDYEKELQSLYGSQY
ncbi:MAG: hypothetical protein IIY45_13505 [Firmicutes bacterium]|nr:hypothetical protein [Bacillota bacterium]